MGSAKYQRPHTFKLRRDPACTIYILLQREHVMFGVPT